MSDYTIKLIQAEYAMCIEFIENDKSWSAWFPQFPGCVTAGENTGDIHKIWQCGHEALQFHIDGMLEDGQTIPGPHTGFVRDGDNKSCHAVFWIEVVWKDVAEGQG